MKVKIFYVHGWSYEADFFYDFARKIPLTSCFYNRGYVTSPFTPAINPQEHNIALTHSMGLFFLLQNYNVNDFKKIIIISGFSKFPVSHKMLERMQEGLLKNPLLVLKKFRKNAGDVSDFKTNNFNISLLIEDLEILKQYDANTVLKEYYGQIYHIHGEQDEIIPYPACGILADSYKIIPEVGHVFSLQENVILEKNFITH